MSRRTNNRANLTIVIPARNEEECIVKNLQTLDEKVSIPHNIIVVNDRSTDRTESLVLDYAGRYKNVRIVSTTPKKTGFTNAIKTGLDANTTPLVAVMMGDLSDDPRTIDKMHQKIIRGWDVVCGSRYIKGGDKKGGPKLQGLLSWAVSKTLKLLTGILVSDVSNPFRMYKKEVIDKVKNTKFGGYESSIEILFRIFMSGGRITEVPTVWRGRTMGKSKFKILKRVPGYASLYVWVLLNAWSNNSRKLFRNFPINV